MDLVVCSLLFGMYLFGIIMPFFGEALTIFGLLGFFVVLLGGVVGGVIGVLLPKSTTGITLGVFLASLTCLVSYFLNEYYQFLLYKVIT